MLLLSTLPNLSCSGIRETGLKMKLLRYALAIELIGGMFAAFKLTMWWLKFSLL